jgi:rootletin
MAALAGSGVQETELLRVRQDMVNRIIQTGEKSLERKPEDDSQPKKPERRYPLRERKAKVFTDHLMYNAFQTKREPETFSEAMSGNDKEKWVDAVTEEFSALRKSVQDEKGQCGDTLDKMRQAMPKLENEKRSLQEELIRNELRATRLVLHGVSLEGDLQRLQMILQEKDWGSRKEG